MLLEITCAPYGFLGITLYNDGAGHEDQLVLFSNEQMFSVMGQTVNIFYFAGYLRCFVVCLFVYNL